MVRGVFARLQHDHYFVEDNGGTIMRDEFEFAAPLGPLGWLAEQVALRSYLRRLLERRNLEIKAVAESDAWRQFVPAN
jgi:ligand-binding SRPBCC domain-containing protein